MTEREALKLALEALEDLGMKHFESTGEVLYKETFTAIKEALAQPEQEPVAWVSTTELLVMRGNALGGAKDWRINLGLVKQDGDVGLYTTPPQRKPLTEEDCRTGFREQDAKWTFRNMTAWQVWRTACEWNEAAHGIKENT